MLLNRGTILLSHLASFFFLLFSHWFFLCVSVPLASEGRRTVPKVQATMAIEASGWFIICSLEAKERVGVRRNSGRGGTQWPDCRRLSGAGRPAGAGAGAAGDRRGRVRDRGGLARLSRLDGGLPVQPAATGDRAGPGAGTLRLRGLSPRDLRLCALPRWPQPVPLSRRRSYARRAGDILRRYPFRR